MYVLDEPTTGLHFADIERLLQVLQRLVDAGNTAIVIEHNLDVIKSADWVVDLGPEGGAAGGLVLVAGTPEEIAGHAGSDTGRFLAPLLTAAPPVPVAPPKRRARKVVANWSTASPPACSAIEVRSHASNVRSLASRNRTSGPTGLSTASSGSAGRSTSLTPLHRSHRSRSVRSAPSG